MVLASPRSGTYYSSDSRHWTDPDTDDVTITHNFNPPYTSEPGIITTLNYVHLTPGRSSETESTIGLKVCPKEISGTQFTQQFGSWGDGGMTCSGCDWLEIMPGDTRYRFGEYRVDRNSTVNAAVTITFDTPFEAGVTPKVVVWLSGFQMAAKKNNNDKWYLTLTPGQPTLTGFPLTVSVPHAALYQATICWFAYKESDSATIRGGTFNATSFKVTTHDNCHYRKMTGKVIFGPPFASPPRIIRGFSSLKIRNKIVITMKVLDTTPIDAATINAAVIDAEDTDPAAINANRFYWKIGAWGDTIYDEAVVSYLAICDP